MAYYNTFIKFKNLPDFAKALNMDVVTSTDSVFEAEIRNPQKTQEVLARIECHNPNEEKVAEICIYDRGCATPQDVKKKYL